MCVVGKERQAGEPMVAQSHGEMQLVGRRLCAGRRCRAEHELGSPMQRCAPGGWARIQSMHIARGVNHRIVWQQQPSGRVQNSRLPARSPWAGPLRRISVHLLTSGKGMAARSSRLLIQPAAHLEEGKNTPAGVDQHSPEGEVRRGQAHQMPQQKSTEQACLPTRWQRWRRPRPLLAPAGV